MFHAILLALTTAPLPLQESKVREPRPPPGMVWIEGGKTKIGTDVKSVAALAEMDELLFVPTACETPQYEVNVPGFYLGVNELTNEQYTAFVKATGHRAPESWGGQEPPKGAEVLPVVRVDYQDAEAYARWAGVHLMSEFEFERAGRGKDARSYPWGDAFDPERALTNAAKATAPKPVGSFPTGATPEGVQDLCGNVWEWTCSSFTPFSGWKVLELDLGKAKGGKKLEGQVKWDENLRVVVGGSFQNDGVAARLTTRRGTERTQSTDAIGLRVAASAKPGVDMGYTVLREDVSSELRPQGVEYDPYYTTGTDRWRSRPGSSQLPGYGVIEGYDYALFVPVINFPPVLTGGLDDMSRRSGPVAVGILSLSLDAVEPALPHGTYFVAYLAKDYEKQEVKKGGQQDSGHAERSEELGPVQEPAADELPPGTDRTRNNLLFYSLQDQAVAAFPVGDIKFGHPREARASASADQLTLSVTTWVNGPNVGLTYDIPLRFASGTLGEGWRN